MLHLTVFIIIIISFPLRLNFFVPNKRTESIFIGLLRKQCDWILFWKSPLYFLYVHCSASLWAYPHVYTVFIVGSRVASVALPFGAHVWYNKAIPGTNTGNHSHWAAMSLKTKVEVHPQSMLGDISLSSPSALLLIRLTDQTAITRSRFISETTSQPPHPRFLPTALPSHLNTSPAPQQTVLGSMYRLRRVCHVNSVDWSAQQSCFLEGRPLPLPLLLSYPHSPAAAL